MKNILIGAIVLLGFMIIAFLLSLMLVYVPYILGTFLLLAVLYGIGAVFKPPYMD